MIIILKSFYQTVRVTFMSVINVEEVINELVVCFILTCVPAVTTHQCWWQSLIFQRLFDWTGIRIRSSMVWLRRDCWASSYSCWRANWSPRIERWEGDQTAGYPYFWCHYVRYGKRSCTWRKGTVKKLNLNFTEIYCKTLLRFINF